jgi:hypothetical protein
VDLSSPYIQLLLWLAGPAVVALVASNFRLWVLFTNYKLYVAEHYTKKTDLQPLQRDVREMKGLIYQIAAKVGVEIQNPF